MTEPKRIMVLGAGLYQIPLIGRAKALGCHVTTVDNIPGNIGHLISDASFDISTVEVNAVLGAARESGIDAVLTYASDAAVPTVAAIASELGLQGATPQAAAILTNKAKFRAFQADHGLDAPRFVSCGSVAEALRLSSKLSRPFVVKPVDTSGSRGIVGISQSDGDRRIGAAVEAALGYSRAKVVCIEELVQGIHASGDVFLEAGRIVGGAMTRKYMKEFLVLGHEMASGMPPECEARILAAVENTCRLAGYLDGPLDFDVVVSQERAVIIEMTPRLGGNGIPELVEATTGFDLIGHTIRFALGSSRLQIEHMAVRKAFGSTILASDRDGILRHITEQDRVMKRVPELSSLNYGVVPGARVSAFEHGGASLGYALFEIPEGGSHADISRRVRDALELEVDVCGT